MTFLIDNIDVTENDDYSTIRKKVVARLGAHSKGLRIEVVGRRYIRTENGGIVRLNVLADTNEFLRQTSSFSRPLEFHLPNEPLAWKARPVVVGLGVSGLVAALYLARRGLAPIVLEKNSEPSFPRANRNASFPSGAGGLMARVGGLLRLKDMDPRLKIFLQEEGVSFPNPDLEQTLSAAKVEEVCRTLIKRINELGGEIRFASEFVGIKKSFGRIKGAVYLNGGEQKLIKTNKVLLTFGACDDTYYVGTSIPIPLTVFNESVYGKKVIDSRLPAFVEDMPLKGRGHKAFLLTGLTGASISDIGTPKQMCLQLFDLNGKGRHTHSLLAIETTKEEAFALCKNAYDAGKPRRFPCALISDFLAKRSSLRLGAIKPEKAADVRLANFAEILGSTISKKMTVALLQAGKAYDYLNDKDAIFEGLFILSGSADDSPRLADGLYVSCVAATKCMDFAAKATSGFKAAQFLCE